WGRHEAVHATSSAAGITSIASELGSKRLGLLRELLPDIRTISLQAVVLVVPRVHRASRARDSRRSANLMTVAVAVHRDGNCGQLPFLKFMCGSNATLRAKVHVTKGTHTYRRCCHSGRNSIGGLHDPLSVH